MTQTAAPTAYDVVTYPSGVFATTHPQHLAVAARLAGLSPPPVETARVLEIGGGDGMNLLNMAVAHPRAQFLNVDLAPTPIARGQAIATAAGLTNIRIEVGDIIELAETMEERFDYVIAHGVYAWIPAPVREALLRLIGRVLSPQGVAYLSYNALPGGHLRRVVRDMALHHVRAIADPIERAQAAKAFLADYARPREGDRPLLAAMRDVARPISTRPIGGVSHDELGDCYEPQAFLDVAAAAGRYGLSFLNEADPGLFELGLPGRDMSEADVLHAVQATDFEIMCFFHQMLLVRAESAPARKPVLPAIRDLYAAAQCERTEPTSFSSPHGTFGISDVPLADAVARLGEVWPARLRIGNLVEDEMRLEAVYRLAEAKAIELFSTPQPAALTPGERPIASPLVRALIAMGETMVFTVDQRALLLDEPGPRAFIALLDGSRDRAALAADWAASGYGHEVDVETALARFAAACLLVA